CVFFFLQAEDGIRDWSVTGVQTCALPIYLRRHPEIGCRVSHQPSNAILAALEANELDIGVLCPPRRLPRTIRITHNFEDAFTLKIGRASCRERVEMSVVAVSLRKKSDECG